MITLEQLVSSLEPVKVAGPLNKPVQGISFDSRKVKSGDIFVAIQGLEANGNSYLRQAITAGATAIVSETEQALKAIPLIQVKNTRVALAQLAAEFYGHPQKDLKTIGVTGTNGKTTTTYLIRSILEAARHSTGLLGTVEYFVGKERFSAERTTPESLDLQKYLASMRDSGQTHVAMEVSSHALALKRTHGLVFERAVFTNFSHEHLDFHKTSTAYLDTKMGLFADLKAESVAILNFDDPVCRTVPERTIANSLFFSRKTGEAEVTGTILEKSQSGMDLQLHLGETRVDLYTHLIGDFNLDNILAAAAVARSLEIEPAFIKKGIQNLRSIPGRVQWLETGRAFKCLIDFAHTPDSLKQTLLTCRGVCTGRLIVVFGCGGERDQIKRPEMGKIAEAYADMVYLTSDNPRRETPLKIIKEIDAGFTTKAKRKIVLERKTAIVDALSSAKRGDVVLIAGRGHENHQEINGQKLPFEDRVVAKQVLMPADSRIAPIKL